MPMVSTVPHLQKSRARTAAVVWNVPMIIVFMMWLAAAVFEAYPTDRLGAVLLLLSVSLAGLAILNTHPEGQWSMPFLGFLAMFLFHIGLFASLTFFGTTPGFLVDTDPTWFLAADLGIVSVYLALGFLSFAIGSSVPWLLQRRDLPQADFRARPAVDARRAISNVGSLVLIFSVASWLIGNVQINGPLFFLGSYRSYLDAVDGSLIGVSFMGIGVGLVLCVQSLQGWLSRLGLLSFALFALAGFPLGLRGEVLMPLVAAVGVFFKMAARRPRWLLLGGSAIVLGLITVGRQIRSLGLSASGGADVSVRLLDAVEEMGASMRVLATTAQWHVLNGEPYAMGATYVVPIIRNLRSVVGLPNPPSSEDYGLFNVEIAQRAGNIGGSVIAEAHHNFGVIGIIMILFIWGFVISSTNRSALNPWGVALLGAIGMMFLTHVRNASTPLFFWAIGFLLTIGGASLIVRLNKRPKGSLRGGSD